MCGHRAIGGELRGYINTFYPSGHLKVRWFSKLMGDNPTSRTERLKSYSVPNKISMDIRPALASLRTHRKNTFPAHDPRSLPGANVETTVAIKRDSDVSADVHQTRHHC
jgi:hypothetical protein